jgi:hypothetical protein
MKGMEELKKEVLEKIGMFVKQKAIELCPIDKGELRRSIKYKVEGNSVRIYTENCDYASDMEYGTPPGILSAEEKEDLLDWSKRHKLPGWAVIRKIEKEGIKAGTTEAPFKSAGGTFRPFMRPALYQSLPEIKRFVRESLK